MPRAASEPLEPTASTSRSTRLEPPVERQERIGRCKAAFEQMSRMAWEAGKPAATKIAAMIHEDRKERAQTLDSGVAPKTTQRA